jgi:enterochelin esterase-like enzyme
MNARANDSPSIFDAFLDRIRSANQAEQPARIDELMKHVDKAGSPMVTSDKTAAFIYRGPGERIRIVGDMNHWSSELPLQRVDETDLFVAIGSFPTDARLEYQLLVDDESISDPWCADRVPNGLGANSELAMPGYWRRPVFESVRDGTKGTFKRVKRHELPTGILEYQKEVHIYTPPAYGTDTPHRYPTVYIHDGRDYIEYAHTPAVLDDLIGSHQIRPLVAVFVSPPHRHQPEEPNRTTEYGLNANYARFLCEELVPWIDDRYRTSRSPEMRLMVGDSYAGLAASYITFQHPDVFGLAYSQSGYLSLRADELIHAFGTTERKPIRLFVDVGQYERTVGWNWLPKAETDFLAANRRFLAVLTKRGYDVEYREYPEGHTWGNWRAHLIDALVHFFGTSAKQND